eukprot:13499138-Heterocapsa_arctica.AAC.1
MGQSAVPAEAMRVEMDVDSQKRAATDSDKDEPWAKRGRSEGDDGATFELSRKHSRDRQAEEEMIMEEQIVRGAASAACDVARLHGGDHHGWTNTLAR